MRHKGADVDALDADNRDRFQLGVHGMHLTQARKQGIRLQLLHQPAPFNTQKPVP